MAFSFNPQINTMPPILAQAPSGKPLVIPPVGTPTAEETLASKALLANLQLSVWTARKYDKKVSKEVAESHNTKESAGRFNKRLMPEDAPEHAAILKIAGQARTEHYKLSLPWAADGARILPTTAYWKYTDAMTKHRNAFEQAVMDFTRVYETLREKARVELNGMFREEDYPPAAAVASKFKFALDFYPMPTSGDFRVSLGSEADRLIKSRLEENIQQATQAAMRDLWDRLYTQVNTLAERLNGDKDLRKTGFENLEDLCGILRTLNVTGDKNLERMVDEVLNSGLTSKPEDQTAREELATRAEDIMSKMAGFMGGFQ